MYQGPRLSRRRHMIFFFFLASGNWGQLPTAVSRYPSFSTLSG